MIEKFSLSCVRPPALPTPHDCMIEKVSVDGEYVVFHFEHEICTHDSVARIHPGADSLMIRYHLCGPLYFFCKRKSHTPLFGKEGYVLIDNNKLPLKSKEGLVYLYHTVGYQAIMIKLLQESEILMDAHVDCVEYEWME